MRANRAIDGWYNTERIQARLGWLSPDETTWRAHHAILNDQPATQADGANPAPAR